MMVLVTYDVSMKNEYGSKRLNKVAKICLDYGQRVQNSVFECNLEPAQFVEIKHKLSRVINHKEDSLRFYNLGKNWRNRVDIIGKNDSYDPETDVFIV